MAELSDLVVLNVSAVGEVIDATVATGVAGTTFLLGRGLWRGERATLWRADHATGSVAKICAFDLPPLSERLTAVRRAHYRLHVSATGRFVAVVVDYGYYGAVFDTETGSSTLQIDGGDTYEDYVPLSAVFITHEGRDVIVHRTDWNRLDASDAETGRLLTERGPTSFVQGEERPEHYHDYYHGGLHLSPDGSLILDNGWDRSPYGIPEVWSVAAWLGSNVWESEDGPSKRWARHGYGQYLEPCWLDNDRFALPGIDDVSYPPGPGAGIVRYSDLMALAPGEGDFQGHLVRNIPGPERRLFGDGDLLFAMRKERTTVWDVASGAQIAECEDFSPTVHSRTDRRLSEVRTGTILSRTY